MWTSMTAGIEVPGVAAPRPLPGPRGDHRMPRAWAGTRCCSTPRSCRSRRTSGRPSRWSPRPAGTARTSRARSSRSPASRTASAPTPNPPGRPWRSSLDFIEATGVDVFAPAIGNAHGVYKHDADAGRPAGHRRASRRTGIPMRAARRQRADRRAVHRPDRPRLRQGQHLHRAQGAVHEVEPGRSCKDAEAAGQVGSAVAVQRASQADIVDADRRSDAHLRQRGQGRVSACRP